MSSMKKNCSKNKGISLVEIIVSMGLFALLMTVGAGAVVNVLDARNKAREIRMAVDNVSTALEYMSRELRFGYDFDCEDRGWRHDCPAGDETIRFLDYAGKEITYTLSGGAITRNKEGTVYPLTGTTNMTINNLDFYVNGSLAADVFQPFITIVVKGTAVAGKQPVPFLLQTSVSARSRI